MQQRGREAWLERACGAPSRLGGHSRSGSWCKPWLRGLRGGRPRGAQDAAGAANKEWPGPRRPRLPRASSQNQQLRPGSFAFPGSRSLRGFSAVRRGRAALPFPALRGVGGRRVCAERSPRCGQSPRGGDGRGGGGAAGTRVAAGRRGAAPGALRRCGGAGAFPGLAEGRRVHTGRCARRRTSRSRRPRPGSPALSLPRPQVTSGTAVCRQLPGGLGCPEPLRSSPPPARLACAPLIPCGWLRN